MAAIYLVRHGQASFGAQDYDNLSELGVRQSAVFGEALRARGTRVARVLSGTMRRQEQTARAALDGAGLDVPCELDERWNEYDHLGLLGAHGNGQAQAGSPSDFQHALESAMRTWIAGGSACPETWTAFRGRAEQACRELVEGLGRGETALVFTSGGVIASVCAGMLGGAPETFLAMNRVVVNTGVTKLVSGRSGVSLVSFNEHAHLEGAPAELLTYR